MKAAYFAGLFVSAISFVAAQSTNVPFYITRPIQGATFEAGSSETITWTNGLDETATVTLLTGTNSLSMHSTGITFSVDGADGEYDWTVPTDLPQNATFSLQIAYTDASGAAATSYSSAFSIAGTTGDVVTATFVTGTASSAIAASSAVSSARPSASSVAPSSITQITRASSTVAASSTLPSASPTSNTSDAMTNFKAPSLIISGIAFIASTLFF